MDISWNIFFRGVIFGFVGEFILIRIRFSG